MPISNASWPALMPLKQVSWPLSPSWISWLTNAPKKTMSINWHWLSKPCLPIKYVQKAHSSARWWFSLSLFRLALHHSRGAETRIARWSSGMVYATNETIHRCGWCPWCIRLQDILVGPLWRIGSLISVSSLPFFYANDVSIFYRFYFLFHIS